MKPCARRFTPYTVVSPIVTLSDYTVFFFLIKAINIEPLIANVCSWAVAVALTYILHTALTLEVPISLKGFMGYVAVCLSTLVLGTAFIAISMTYITPIAAKVASTVFVFAVSFALSHLTVFRTV
jgi:putative flippase GtrA